MSAKKGVRNISLSFNDGTSTISCSGKLRGATVYKGSTVEVDKIAAYGDDYYTSVPRSTKSWSEFNFTVLDQGGEASLESLNGKVVTVTITPSYGSGDGADTALNPPISTKMAITNVAPGGEITLDGGTESTITITAVPHGPTN